MSNLHDFLVKHAKFPFPQPDEDRSIDATDISLIEVGLLEREWKPNHAVRDNTLVQKLCSTLENILGDTFLAADAENQLLARFLPRIQRSARGREDLDWRDNPSERTSQKLLDKGVLEAIADCLWEYGAYDFLAAAENVADRGSSKVDYVVQVDGEDKALVEAKSPSVMKKVGESLPPRGVELTWARGQSLVRRILAKAALYLGLRRMEWLFLTCHNYWIVCRLVRDDDHPFLAYSPIISIEDSSVPFQALLGAILSIVKTVSVEPSEFSPDMELDTIVEEQDEGPLPEDDIDNGTAYSVSSEEEMSGLMVTSSSQNSPESFQVWMHLRPFSDNMLALPQCATNGKRRLWLTRFVGSGSTGNVWQCRFDDSVDLFIAKVVEVLRPADADNRKRLHNEFDVYLTLEKAYQSGQLRDHIAPRCYGAFEGDGVDVLILDLCDGVLNEWGELSDPEK
ncbi:hypothetical protein D9615_005925 [Tricholomella constricta]|uniref:Protein kinase domain-containing protein n=1 Tax=Tricholomella constricta TaxID=117010 RepID=A0A8H5M3B2_9AGAR|nr:hypothetical protein D9615_005925 [Tricholomella constricta]